MSANPAELWRQSDVRYKETRTATLITWSTIHAAPSGYEDFAPYIVAIIEFSDGSRTCVQLADCVEEQLTHGMPMRPVFRKMYTPDASGVIPYGTKYIIG